MYLKIGVFDKKQSNVVDIGEWSDSGWKWKFTWRRLLLVWEHEAVQDLCQHLEGKKPTMGKRDGWRWCHDEGQYTVKQLSMNCYTLLVIYPN